MCERVRVETASATGFIFSPFVSLFFIFIFMYSFSPFFFVSFLVKEKRKVDRGVFRLVLSFIDFFSPVLIFLLSAINTFAFEITIEIESVACRCEKPNFRPHLIP